MRKITEMQGPEIVPTDAEDEIWVRDEYGELVKLEVSDDVEDD